MVIMSLTGSAVVFRGELGRLLTPVPRVVPSGPRRTREQLTADAERALQKWTVTEIVIDPDPTSPVEIRMRRGQRRVDKIFNPYTGEMIGERVPREPRVIEQLADLHDNLLFGARGRFANGIGAIALTVLCITGAVVWWPRAGAWKRAVTISVRGSWRHTVWTSHSAVGFWLLSLLLIWALSGVYLAFPAAFDSIAGWMDAAVPSGRLSTPMFRMLAWISDVHFGRFSGTTVKALWVVLGLTPTFLLATGGFLWWTRFRHTRTAPSR